MLIGVIPGAGTLYLYHVPGTPRYYLIPGPGHPPSKPPDRQLVVSTHAQKSRPAGVRMFTRVQTSLSHPRAGGRRTECRAAWDGTAFVKQPEAGELQGRWEGDESEDWVKSDKFGENKDK